MKKKCRVCEGVGKILGGGMIVQDCADCEGKGYVEWAEDEAKKEASVAPIVPIVPIYSIDMSDSSSFVPRFDSVDKAKLDKRSKAYRDAKK